MENDPIVDAALLNKTIRKPVVEQILYKLTNSQEELWKWRVISGILQLTLEHYDRLIDANERSFPQHTIAYHSRCLLELVVWTEFALESDDNIKKINADTLNDNMDLIAKFKASATRFTDLQFLSELIAAENRLKGIAKRDELKEPTKEFIETRKLPAAQGQGGYYDVNFKFLSKLAHPCSFSIVKMSNDATDPTVTQAIIREACRWFILSMRALSTLLGLEICE